tara:strand:+ start:116 stop:1369 length:1254 start_codon:yes stop_codon:yes gene_type:complete
MMESTDFYFASTTTSGGSTTTAVDTGIVKYDSNKLVGKWLLCTSGSNDGVARKITSVSTTTMTTDAFASVVATSVTYEVMVYDPMYVHEAINRSVRTALPDAYVALRDETLVVDDLLSNSLFETFDSTFTNWTNVGSPTVTKEAALMFEGAGCAKVVAGGGAAGQMTQQPTITGVEQLQGKTVKFVRWVAALADNVGRIRLTFDGSTYTSSGYVNGGITTAANGLDWEKLWVSALVPDGATQVTAVCEAAAGGTAYFDGPGGLWIDNKARYTLPASIILGPHYVMQQDNLARPNGSYSPIAPTNLPRSGYKFRLLGLGRLSSLTSDASTIEVGEETTEILVAEANSNLFRRMMRAEPGMREKHEADAIYWNEEYSRLREQTSLHKPRLGSQTHQVFHLEEDSAGRYLVLNHGRGGSA